MYSPIITISHDIFDCRVPRISKFGEIRDSRNSSILGKPGIRDSNSRNSAKFRISKFVKFVKYKRISPKFEEN